jgi:hypothetical protein
VRRFDSSLGLGAFQGRVTMPRYFFHFLDKDTNNLVQDSVGCSLSDTGQAKKEAIGLARDIATHGLHGAGWQVIVTDADTVILSVSHSDIRPRRMKPLLDLARRIVTYEPNFQPHIFAWLLTALVFAVIVQATVTTSVRGDKAEVTGSLHHE